MARPKVLSAREAVGLIPDGAIVTVSSSSALGCPDAVLAAIGARFDAEGHPRNLTTLHPIAAGDMWGVKGIDHIAKPGCLARVLAGSYPSGPSSAEPPAIWKMISGDAIPAYNVPSGILFDMHREAAAKRPGVLTKVGMDTFVDPVREGCAMNAKAARRADRQPRPLRRRRLAVLPDDHARCRDHPRDHRRRARQSLLRARRRHSRAARSGARRPQQRRPCHRAGQAPRRGRVAAPARRRRSRRAGRRASSSRPTRCRRPTRPTSRRSRARSSGRCRRSRRRSSSVAKVDRAARRAGVARRRRRQHRLRHLGQRAAHPDRGRPARRGDLGDRAGRRRRRAAARLPVRLRLQRRGDRARRRSSSPTFRAAASTCRCFRSCRSTAQGSVNVSKLGVRPHVTAGAGGFVDITARAKKIVFSGYFTAGAELEIDDGALRIAQGRQGQEARRSGRADLVLRPARGRAGAGHRLRHRALRDAARARGRHRRSRSRRASISSATCSLRPSFRCGSPSDSRRWTRRCSIPSRSDLILRPAEEAGR